MNKLGKYIGYFIIFVLSFVVFFYLMFPFDALTDRALSFIEAQMNNAVKIDAAELEPYYFTGFEAKNLGVSFREKEKGGEIISIDEMRARAGLFSLLFSRPNVAFLVEAGDGVVEGEFDVMKNGWALDLDSSAFDISALKLLSSKYGLNSQSSIDGNISLVFDRTRPVVAEGRIDLTFDKLLIKASKVSIAGSEIDLPELMIAKGKNSAVKLRMEKGVVEVDKFTFAGGELNIDLSGRIFMSRNIDDYRFNLKGKFKVSKKLEEVLPFMFLIDKQKDAEGNYELSITGRIGQPVIRIGNFTLPI